MEELKKKNNEDLEKVYAEKVNGLNGQIAILTNTYNQQLAESQKLQNEKLGILNEQISTYKSRAAALGNKPSVNWMLVIITLILGLVIGYLLKWH